MEIKNATTVHQVWEMLHEAALLGAFQSDRDAETFCKAAADHQPKGAFLVSVSHYDGRMRCFHKSLPAGEPA